MIIRGIFTDKKLSPELRDSSTSTPFIINNVKGIKNGDMLTSQILEEASEKWDIYHIHITHDSDYYRDASVVTFSNYLGEDNVMISDKEHVCDSITRIITPYDVLVDTTDNKVISDGTCGKGIHATFNKYKYGDMLCHAEDLYYTSPMSLLTEAREFHILSVEPELEKLFINSVNYLLKNNVIHVLDDVFDTIEENEYTDYIYEGSQGLLLDMERGFMPHCTPSKVGLNALSESIIKDSEVYIVLRPYLTRHGNGYEPKFSEKVQEYFYINEPSNTNDGPQGKFKYGLFNLDLFKRALDRHCIDNYKNCTFNIVVTHYDCLIDNKISYIIGNQLVYGLIEDLLYELKHLPIPINKIYLGKGENSIIEEYWSRN